MKVQNTVAMFLALTEREASGEKKAWTSLDYIIFGENTSRRTFIDREDSVLLAAARSVCSRWGEVFKFDGEVNQRGDVTFTSLYPAEGMIEDFLDE